MISINLTAPLPTAVPLGMMGCGSNDAPDDEPDTGHRVSSSAGEAFAQVHGLGESAEIPYIPTHNGRFAVDGDGAVYVAADAAVLVSRDEGATFESYYSWG